MTFNGPGKGKAILVEDNSADCGIINMDSANAKELWGDYHKRYPGKPAIVLSVKDPGIKDTFYVRKPAGIDDMLAAVDKLINELGNLERAEAELQRPAVQEEIEAPEAMIPAMEEPAMKPDEISAMHMEASDSSTSPDDLPLAPSSPVTASAQKSATAEGGAKDKDSPFYNPKEYLQGEIHSAVEFSKKWNIAVELWIMTENNKWKKMIFLPRIEKVLTSLTSAELKHYCSSPLFLVNYKMYRRKEKETVDLEHKVSKENRGVSYDAFLWRVALSTSMGRLPQGTNLNTAMYLKHWPNFTRLYPIAGAMRIATLLTDQPRSLPIISKVLKLPLGRVYSFYSAAYAIGIVGSSDQEAISLAKSTIPEKHRDHTLFGRILKRLRKDESNFESYA